jgi:hypothetical protein
LSSAGTDRAEGVSPAEAKAEDEMVLAVSRLLAVL